MFSIARLAGNEYPIEGWFGPRGSGLAWRGLLQVRSVIERNLGLVRTICVRRTAKKNFLLNFDQINVIVVHPHVGAARA